MNGTHPLLLLYFPSCKKVKSDPGLLISDDPTALLNEWEWVRERDTHTHRAITNGNETVQLYNSKS